MERRKFVYVLAAGAPLLAQETYKQGPDSFRQEGVPKGKIAQFTWTSKIYPGSVRDYWVYVPSQYKPENPACVMIFQDGGGMVREDGQGFKVPVVFDNLIHKGEMPVTIGIFINPGVVPAATPESMARYHRSLEYDGLGDLYARFLLEEILPEVGKSYKLSGDPDHYAIAGSSSGGIAAFTAAWNRPDKFRRVMSFVGSYVNLRGGQDYSSLIRKTEPKPLRIYLQDGSNDQNIYAGNWWIANQDMSAALDYAGYEHTFVKGTEGHNGKHGSAVLPDALRWLWKDFPKPVQKGVNKTDRHFLAQAVIPGEEWQLVSEGHRFTEGPAVNRQGEVFFTDVSAAKIHKIGLDGKVSLFKEDSGNADGMMFAPDGRLIACQNGRKRIVAYAPDGKETVLAEGVESNDICVNAKGQMWFTDSRNRRVWFIDTNGAKKVVFEGGPEFPNGIALSTDQALLMVADTRSKWVWSFQVQPDGSLVNGLPFHHLETWDTDDKSGADGMTVDTEGMLYVATRLGIQVCDQPGRVVAILNAPEVGAFSNIVFGGPDLSTLYGTFRSKVYKRTLRRKGVNAWTVLKPPQPRL